MLSAAQRATASGARIFQLLDRKPAMTVPDGAPPLPAGPGRCHLRTSGSGSPARPPGPARRQPGHRGRTDDGAGGRDGVGQDRADLAAAAPVRRHRGQGPDRRRRVRAVDLAQPPPGDRARQRRPVPVLGHGARQHRLRPARGHARARWSAPPERPRPHGFIQRLPDGYDTLGRRTRPDPVRRPAPADRDRPRDPGRPADPRAGRRHLLGRCLHRAGDQARAARGDGRPDDVHDRPPPVDDRAGR